MLRLYVWRNAFYDHRPGLAVALAEDAEQARDLIRTEIGYPHGDLGARPEVFEMDGAAVAFYVPGGG